MLQRKHMLKIKIQKSENYKTQVHSQVPSNQKAFSFLLCETISPLTMNLNMMFVHVHTSPYHKYHLARVGFLCNCCLSSSSPSHLYGSCLILVTSHCVNMCVCVCLCVCVFVCVCMFGHFVIQVCACLSVAVPAQVSSCFSIVQYAWTFSFFEQCRLLCCLRKLVRDRCRFVGHLCTTGAQRCSCVRESQLLHHW